jgi:hypothetical protein
MRFEPWLFCLDSKPAFTTPATIGEWYYWTG